MSKAGTQPTPRGPAQGTVIIDPNTGLPVSVSTNLSGKHAIHTIVDGTITVSTRDLDHTTDNVAIKGSTGNQLVVNTDGSIDTNVIVSAPGDTIAISDGTHTLDVNSDGSINVDSHLYDGAGNAITSQSNGSKRALDVGIDVAGVQVDPRAIRTLTSADTVTISSGTVSVGQSVVTVSNTIRNDYLGSPVTTAAYVQLIASTSAAIKKLEIFDSSGQTLVLATGASGFETNLLYIIPGGNGQINIDIAASTRLSIKAISANATSGEITINAYNVV